MDQSAERTPTLTSDSVRVEHALPVAVLSLASGVGWRVLATSVTQRYVMNTRRTDPDEMLNRDFPLAKRLQDWLTAGSAVPAE